MVAVITEKIVIDGNEVEININLEYSSAAFAKHQSGGVPVITDSPVRREKSLS